MSIAQPPHHRAAKTRILTKSATPFSDQTNPLSALVGGAFLSLSNQKRETAIATLAFDDPLPGSVLLTRDRQAVEPPRSSELGQTNLAITSQNADK